MGWAHTFSALLHLSALTPPLLRSSTLLRAWGHSRIHDVVASAAGQSKSPVAAGQSKSPVELHSGMLVELWHAGGLGVGVFRGRSPTGSALLVEVGAENIIKIDAGQLVDVWEGNSESLLHSEAGWAEMHSQAAMLLRELPPHMIDLRPLWKRITEQKVLKGARKVVDSQQVARYLFTSAGQQLLADTSELPQRFAAGQLLAEERALFKRIPGSLQPSPLGEDSSASGESVWWSGGGFKPLPKAQANSRAEGAFLETAKKRISMNEEELAAHAWPPSTLPLLADLEMVALGLVEVSKPLGRLLNALEQPLSEAGARHLLVRIGQWHDDGDDDDLDEGDEPWLDPFPAEVLREAARTAAGLKLRCNRYQSLQPPPVTTPHADGAGGKKPLKWLNKLAPRLNSPLVDVDSGDGLNQRVDLRSRCNRVYAIDGGSTEFRDDAISFNLELREIMVHIVDLTSVVRPESTIDDVARLRLQSIYTSAMPLHMLPPALLSECSLSDMRANECLSAVFKIEAGGRFSHCRLLRSVIPPVTTLSFEEMDEIITDSAIDSQVHRELRALAEFMRTRAAGRGRKPERSPSSVRWRGSIEGGWTPEIVVKTAARTIVDEALSMYSYAARRTAMRSNLIRLPQTEHQRVGTGPLRRYSDLVAQRQLCAALCGESGMPVGEAVALERWIKGKHAELQVALQRKQQPQMLRALESHCARQAALSRTGYAILHGTFLGNVRRQGVAVRRQGAAHLEIRLEQAGGVIARASLEKPLQAERARALKPGQKLRVRLCGVDARRGLVDVELL